MLLRISGLAALLLVACGGKVYESTGSDPGSSGSNTSGGISSGGASSGSTSGGVSSGGTSSGGMSSGSNGGASGGSTSGGTSSGSTSGGTSSGGPVADPPNCVDWTPVPGVRVSGTRAVREAAGTSDQEYILRAAKPHTTGRYFYEIDVLSQGADPPAYLALGIHNGAGLATFDYCLFDAGGQWIDYRLGGIGMSAGFSSQSTFRFVQNNTIGVGVDLDAQEMSLYINGALREVKQVQNCLGSGPMFPSANLQVNDEIVGRFQNFRYPIAGYAPWGECN